MAPYLEVTESDGYAVLGTNDDYKEALASAPWARPRLRQGDRGRGRVVLFLDFDADDDWLVRLFEDEPELSDNVDPLSAVGVSGWVEGDIVHGVFKVTTD